MVNSVNKSKIINSLFWKFLERFFSQGINLVVQIVLARLLLPEAFGSLAVIVAVTNYASIFVQSGLATTIVQRKNLDHADINTLFTSSIIIAFIFYIVIFAFSPWFADVYGLPELLWPLRILATILFLNAINSIQTALLSREMNFKSIFWRSVLAVPVSGIIGIVMAYCNMGIWALVAHNLSNMFITVIIMSIGSGYKLKFGFSWNRAKSLYSFGGKILLTGLVSGFGDTFRTMLIGKKFNANQLAYYDKGYTYSLYVTQIVNSTLQSVMLPAFSKQQDNLEKLQNYIRKSIGITAFVMFPTLLGVIACAKPMVILLLTSKWIPAIPFLIIFCLLRLPTCLTILDKQVFYALGNSRIGLYYETGLLIVNITVLLITAQISVLAMAIGVTVVEYIGSFLIFVIANRQYHYTLINRLKDIIKPLINSLVMLVMMHLILMLNLSEGSILLIQILIGLTTYLICAIITKDENLNYLLSILTKNKIQKNLLF